ncbi:MAG: diguanylate cyclase [Clostridiales bacterium]|nr:diguanylate cyclase [Clostridiales bacterium]
MVKKRSEIIEYSDKDSLVESHYAYDIVKNSKIVVFEWTLDIDIPTKYVSANINQYGYVPEDFYEGDLSDYWQFVHPEDRNRVKKEVYLARQVGETYSHRYRILTKDGQTRWVEERILYDMENDLIVNEKGIIIDITEQKLLEEKLERSKERYQRIFENSSVIIFTISLEGSINATNKMFRRTLGYDLKDIKDQDIRSILYDVNDLSLILNVAKEFIDESYDVEVVCKTGEIKTLNVSTNIIDSIDEEIEIVAVDISERKIDEQRIRFLSYHDKLTNVYNRAYFDEVIECLDRRSCYPFSIIIGDMNGLKVLNDHYGHKKGDKLLQDMAEICVKSCREKDVVCRIGGDEFAIICPNTNEKGAIAICDRIRELCLETEVELIGNPSIALGYSTKLDKDTTIDEIFKQADNNMYRNKMTYDKSTTGMFLNTLQTMLEQHNFEDKEHSESVVYYAIMLGRQLNLASSLMDDLGIVAKLHDIGKIGVPSDILNKPSSLSDEEYELVKGHAYFGYSILKAAPTTINVADYILHHHEWYDGNGYPDGIKGEQIPIISRIISIVDAYVVMTNDAPYRKAMSQEAAIKELKSCSRTQFDPELVTTFLSLMT